jgi:hypothetical protein
MFTAEMAQGLVDNKIYKRFSSDADENVGYGETIKIKIDEYGCLVFKIGSNDWKRGNLDTYDLKGDWEEIPAYKNISWHEACEIDFNKLEKQCISDTGDEQWKKPEYDIKKYIVGFALAHRWRIKVEG